jgi:hypothetical protein
MTDFRMPDSWYDPPNELEPCDMCDDEGCHLCDIEIAKEYMADLQMQATKERARQ